ncbi:MAG: DUF378 domain-containing protein, partial [Oscillospiraceae bacterium]|nr:DUF378 domain-containing protein [Oscillospiraceae bacterium]
VCPVPWSAAAGVHVVAVPLCPFDYAVVGLAGLWCVSLLFRERVPAQAQA